MDYLPDEQDPFGVNNLEAPELALDAVFPSLETVRTTVYEAASEEGWVPFVKSRDRRRIVINCRSDPDCPFHVLAKFDEASDTARITVFDSIHNCLGAKPCQRQLASYMKKILEVIPHLMTSQQRDLNKGHSERPPEAPGHQSEHPAVSKG